MQQRAREQNQETRNDTRRTLRFRARRSQRQQHARKRDDTDTNLTVGDQRSLRIFHLDEQLRGIRPHVEPRPIGAIVVVNKLSAHNRVLDASIRNHVKVVDHPQRVGDLRCHLKHCERTCDDAQWLHIERRDGDCSRDPSGCRTIAHECLKIVVFNLEVVPAIGTLLGAKQANIAAELLAKSQPSLRPVLSCRRHLDSLRFVGRVGDHQLRHAFSKGGDRQRRVGTDRARHDRAVGHVEARMHIVALKAGKYAPAIVDHAVGCIVGHVASTQRMHRDETTPQHAAFVDRRTFVDRVQFTRKWRRERVRFALCIRTASVVPLDTRAAAVDLEMAFIGIVAHRQHREGPRVRAAVGRTERAPQTLRTPRASFQQTRRVRTVVGIHATTRPPPPCERQQWSKRARHSAIFDDDAATRGFITSIDDAGDARPDLVVGIHIPGSADSVHHTVAVIRKCEVVAIAAHSRAEARRRREPSVARTHQNFG